MTSRCRWLIVAVGVLLLCVTPYAVSLIPAARSEVTAAGLLARITASSGVAFSGYAKATGSLALPSASEFSSVADLLGAQTDLRIWWRGARDWRVDAVALTGETDVEQDANGIWTWDYERDRAARVDFQQAPAARLPRADDLAPGSLARRLLVQATPTEVSRLPSERIAGQDAAGLRLRPDEPQSTIKQVDVWALPSSGLPVKVKVYGSSGRVVMETSLLDLSTSTPTKSDTSFTPPARAEIDNDGITDVVSAVNRFVQAVPPPRLAGLDRASGSTAALGSVGVYGRGVTALVAVPLPGRIGDSIDTQLGGNGDGGADAVAFGPLTLRLTARSQHGTRWLLAGTVTPATLARAEQQLPAIEDFVR